MSVRRVESIMGMPIEIDARDECIADSDLDLVFDWFRRIDYTFSTYRPDSQISSLNTGASAVSELEPDVRTVLRRCDELRVETGGYFEVKNRELPVHLTSTNGRPVTHGIDPSGYVKGWSVDRAAEILTSFGGRNFSVNAGGDIRVKGGALPEPSWRVGIQHPKEQERVAAVLVTCDLAVATSGDYLRGRHIMNPHTGFPPDGVLSVTVVGSDLGTADAYATAAFAMGDEGPRWTMGLSEFEAMTVLDNDLVLFTPNFPRVTSREDG